MAQVLGRKLIEVGHDVALGTRSPGDLGTKRGMGSALGEWLESVGGKTHLAGFAEVAAHGETIINATAGAGSLDAPRRAPRRWWPRSGSGS